MKFKKLLSITFAFFGVLALSSCHDESENIIPQPSDPVLMNAGVGGEGELAERD